MPWTQNYDALGSVLSTLVAALPIVLLLGLLATGRVSAPAAALAGLAAAVLAAFLAFTPAEAALANSGGPLAWAGTVLAAAGHGAAFGLMPIGWIVLNAIFLYALTVETGQFEIVKHSVMSLSQDRRIQALLIAFCFGAFVEGAAGFGTPVAISAALLLGAGFKPLHAAGLALIANTSPVAFGALGTPTITLARVTGLNELQLSAMAGRQLPLFSLIVPAWLVWTMAGWRETLRIWPALLVCGGSFALAQFLITNYHGPSLVDVVGGVVSLVCLALFLQVWQPRRTWHFPDEPRTEAPRVTYTARQVASAWMPWVLLTIFVFLWGLPQVKSVFGKATARFRTPALHGAIVRDYPVVNVPKGITRWEVQLGGLLAAAPAGPLPALAVIHTVPKAEEAVYDFPWLAATGTGIFLAAVLSAVWLGVAPARFVRIYAQTCYRMRWPLFTIACMLAIAFTTRYTGMDATLGLAFTRTGWIYPLFAALLGWLGVALTGSDTSSNALFGNLQTITARRLVADGVLPLTETQAEVLLATANSTGGVMGKMIDAQSIVVASAATQQPGQEGAILRFVFWHSLALALLMGLLVLIQAYVWRAAIP